MNPIQIHVLDLSGDGNPDIVLETDERANGGLGVIVAHIYVENNGQYAEVPLSEELHASQPAARECILLFFKLLYGGSFFANF
ncbi:hypothetical protein D3C73_579840 [compost metagenome]